MSKAQGIAQSANQGQFKNRLINSDMRIDQRNAGASVTPANGAYTLDRWYVAQTAGASKFSVQQNAGSVTRPAGFTNYLGATSLSAYTVGATDQYALRQMIEGFNVADLSYGTASASPITLSFWVRSSLTGTFGGSLYNPNADRSYVFSYTISAANTWEYKTISFVGDTASALTTNNGAGLLINLSIGYGSTYSTSVTGGWVSGFFGSATGATSVVGTNGATFNLTGVQLEKGSTATSFDYRPYGTELALCQRYYAKMSALSNYTGFGTGLFDGGTTGAVVVRFPVTMRATPTFSYSTLAVYDGSAVLPVTALRTTYGGSDSVNQDISVASGGTVNRPINLVANNSTSAFVALSAEL